MRDPFLAFAFDDRFDSTTNAAVRHHFPDQVSRRPRLHAPLTNEHNCLYMLVAPSNFYKTTPLYKTQNRLEVLEPLLLLLMDTSVIEKKPYLFFPIYQFMALVPCTAPRRLGCSYGS